MAWFGSKRELAAYNRGYDDAISSLPSRPPIVKKYSFDGCAWCGGKVETFHRASRGHIRWHKYCSVECDKIAQHFRVFFHARGGSDADWNEALASKEVRTEFANYRNAKRVLKQLDKTVQGRLRK